MTKPLYGSLLVTYRDGTEATYVTYMEHLVNYELEFGSIGDAGIAGTARLAYLTSGAEAPFDEWLKTVAYVVPGANPAGDDEGEPTEPVPTE